MLRITHLRQPSGAVTLGLAGRVVNEWATVLAEEGRRSLGQADGVALDLSQVTYVDNEGVTVIRDLLDHGATIVNCPDPIGGLLGIGEGPEGRA